MFLVEGKKMVDEALNSSWKVECLVCKEAYPSESLPSVDLPIYQASPTEFKRISSQQHPEGIIAVLSMRDSSVLRVSSLESEGEEAAYLLWRLKDPGNLGTILRTADWLNIPTVYLTEDCVDVFNPKSIRASMGSLFRCQLRIISHPIEAIMACGKTIWVADMEGKQLQDVSFGKDDIILIGSESQGVDTQLKTKLAHQKISIPRLGGGESLNAAVSASIIGWQYKLKTTLR
ncbi:MAG: RNA methyltransferase [Bacteroidota bacterium]